jgi:hypothetical protein
LCLALPKYFGQWVAEAPLAMRQKGSYGPKRSQPAEAGQKQPAPYLGCWLQFLFTFPDL